MSDPGFSVGTMISTRDAATVAAEVCPACASADVRAVEADWFWMELERGDELRDAEVVVEFSCRECGWLWC